MKRAARSILSFPLAWIFVVAVLLPSTALCILALRSADRESLYAQRRFESALAAEAGLAAERADEVMRGISQSLEEIARYSDTDDWRAASAVVETPFELRGGEISFPAATPRAERDAFLLSFGDFLRGGAALPTYDSVTRIYRSDYDDYPYINESKLSPAPPAKRSGVDRQRAESMLAADSEVMSEALSQASSEGFELSARNVAPTAGLSKAAPVPAAPPMKEGISEALPTPEQGQLSRTVSRRRSFTEVTGESDYGLLPRLSENGLSILFWAKRQDAIAGCSLNMAATRDLIAEAIPGVLTDVRVLNVLDENGDPIVESETFPALDWRRPFVAREISPSLPRWEAGAWLVDPDAPALRARFTRIAVSVLVAALFVVMASGGILVARAVTAETRAAAQKTAFVANVTHELKTPLTSIRLFSELLLSGKQTDENRRRDYLRGISAEAGRLSALVEDVLTFSARGRNYPMSPLDLSDMAREVLSIIEPRLAASGFTVSLSADGPVPVRGNREALAQVLTNMLSNAEKYSGDVKEITVTAGRCGETAVLSVLDRGIGVKPGISAKIFQEFFRGDDSLSAMRSGVGLGLSIARGIAERHGGSVTYSPRDGGGSVFSLSLPLDASSPR
ncbi:MAG: HAMP domain-containing histidine kinase [Synergistaceae bacterium]|jgi:signal transduction histidine kinase|nr:HAMP domain-containing histidine kinase [Synergistaceae bacterium]